MPLKAAPIFEGKAAMVRRPELPSLFEPEEEPLMMVLMAEMMMLQMRHMTESEHQIAVGELERETATAEVTRCKAWGMYEHECETEVVEVPRVARLERSRL